MSLALDPRTKMVLVIATSVAVMTPGGQRFVPAAIFLGVCLAASVQAWRRAVLLPAIAVALAGVTYGLPSLLPHPVTVTTALASAYALRFVAVAGVAAHLVATTTPSALTSALVAARMPRAVVTPTSVMVRFVPVVAAEARAVADAMRLRGLGGWRSTLRHPVTTIERFTVPMLGSSLRITDDLSASALLRGVGSPPRPTCLHPPRLRAFDGGVALATALLAWLTIGAAR